MDKNIEKEKKDHIKETKKFSSLPPTGAAPKMPHIKQPKRSNKAK